ncbi:hypothetical protein ENBRE01_1250 [Enteropsectra breve]|nr:hypothetical protein ENBRE01_1250 [Enteropsectra breve]
MRSLKQKEKILKAYHLEPEHGISETMLFLMLNTYSWKDMQKDIKMVRKRCRVYLKDEGNQTNDKENELWELGLMGRIPCKNGENKFILWR